MLIFAKKGGMNNNPLVTIGIPVYNVEAYIRKCLLSVLEQTYQEIEIIVVDDCGTDNSMQIVDELRCSHPNGKKVRIIKHSHNKGIGEARNTMIENCSGEYLFFVDSDDYVEHNAIEILLSEAIQCKTDVVIASHKKISYTTGEELPTYKYSSYHLIRGKDEFAKFVCADLRWHIAVVVWNILFSVSFLRENYIRFAGRKDEDALFLSDYYSEVESAVILPNITYYYVARPDSIMGYMSRKVIPIREIRERFATDAIMTERCSRLRGRSFFDVHCARVMKHKFRAVCVALRHRKHFSEPLSDEEIYEELKCPVHLGEIFSFRRYKMLHLFFYMLDSLPPLIAIRLSFIIGKTIRWI
ncbi:Glycosyl transferase family 2 [Xylanibacter ruminicola]|uniref:Glycosyl transferase family 2 n=1 Tax=Xylanibacter ruminicola TaxID=839 RepID=A0A1M7GSX9_XYLRU|nr:glycosyltransferase family 2 protein [Xylanibacter ruminicola]SHM19403.1 Glycosyl transferase family 2 [Xylanibacter ruminicola]